jgi:hypothetical protein
MRKKIKGHKILDNCALKGHAFLLNILLDIFNHDPMFMANGKIYIPLNSFCVVFSII